MRAGGKTKLHLREKKTRVALLGLSRTILSLSPLFFRCQIIAEDRGRDGSMEWGIVEGMAM